MWRKANAHPKMKDRTKQDLESTGMIKKNTYKKTKSFVHVVKNNLM